MNRPSTIKVNQARRTAARRRVALLVGIATLVAGFYGVENWRGRRAWEACQGELANGAKMDRSAFVPIPDDQNVFKAPRMAAWFLERRSGDLSQRLSPNSFAAFLRQRHTNILVEMTLVSRPVVASNAADLVLRFGYRALSVASNSSHEIADSSSVVIPVLQLQEVPLTAAIANLARNANVNYILDPHLPFHGPAPDGRPGYEPHITLRWENLTARQALDALLKNYNCVLVENPHTGIALIRALEPGASVFMTAEARSALKDLTKGVLERWKSGAGAPCAEGCQAFTFVAGELSAPQPARILVQLDTTPTGPEISEILPRGLRIESDTNDVFQLSRDYPGICAAKDYLEWSDQFEPEFETMREAFQRPHVQRGPEQPLADHWLNFPALRMVTQTLAQRAQCQLLLGRSQHALRELTLIHDLRRLLASEPVSLVAAMLSVSVADLYAGCVADGLRLRMWDEPALKALQSQLDEIKLPPLLVASLEAERVGKCQLLQSVTPAQFVDHFISEAEFPPAYKSNLWQRLNDPAYVFLELAPRGWVFQNMANVTRKYQQLIKCFDPARGILEPQKYAALSSELQSLPNHRTPYTFLVATMVPNYTRAAAVTAHHQARVDMALIACALERHRLRLGHYPATLAALMPEFLSRIPNDIIGGQPFRYQASNDQRFRLYSIGWNEVDDGGVPTAWSSRSVKGDWTWEVSN